MVTTAEKILEEVAKLHEDRHWLIVRGAVFFDDLYVTALSILDGFVFSRFWIEIGLLGFEFFDLGFGADASPLDLLLVPSGSGGDSDAFKIDVTRGDWI